MRLLSPYLREESTRALVVVLMASIKGTVGKTVALGPGRPSLKIYWSWALDHPLGQHGVGHLDKSGDIGPLDIVAEPIGTLAVFEAGTMDALHDLLQAKVHFF